MPIFVTTEFSWTGSHRSAFTPGNMIKSLMPAEACRQRPFDLPPVLRIDVRFDRDDELKEIDLSHRQKHGTFAFAKLF